MSLSEFRLRLVPWAAWFVGGVLIVIAIAEQRAAVGWRDLYPGVAALTAGFLLFGVLRYWDRSVEAPDPNEGKPPDAGRTAPD